MTKEKKNHLVKIRQTLEKVSLEIQADHGKGNAPNLVDRSRGMTDQEED